jgi:cytochrome c-type biogenesis protein CcmH
MIWVILAGVLTTATVWFLLRPLAQFGAVAAEGYHQLMQLRDRLLAQLRELDMEEGDANVDIQVAADERLRLEAELARALSDLEALGAPLSAQEGPGAQEKEQGLDAPPQAERRERTLRRMVVMALAVLVPLGSAALYLGTNGPTLARLAQPSPVMSSAEPVPPQVQAMVTRLEQRLAENPNDAKGWALLGRSYEVLGRVDDADRAYASAYRLTPNDAEVLAAYASFLAARHPSAPSPEAVALFRKLLAIDPVHPAALWTLGLAAFHGQKYEEARAYWDRLLKQVPADSEVAPHIRRALEEAQARTGKK